METTEFNRMCWQKEREGFRRVIAAAVEEKLDWQPEPKARSMRRLIGHVIGHVQDMIELADDAVINHRNEVPFDGLENALSIFDAAYDEMDSKLEKMTPEDWTRPADFNLGGQTLMSAHVEELAWTLFFDAIHHRGQMTTHLRPTGSRVPSLYGPSADDMEIASAH